MLFSFFIGYEIVQNRKIHKGKITKIEKQANDLYLISFFSETIDNIEPGQFVSILCGTHTLRRPFSVYDFDKEAKTVSVYFKLKGDGTKYMSSLKIGDTIDFIGAMGNCFSIYEEKNLIIGAGVGFAPVFYLAKKLKNAYKVAAFASEKDIPNTLDADMFITDDGTKGKKGSILNYLDEIIQEVKPKIIYSCGPMIVLKAVAQAGIKYNIKTEIAMEKIMACSVGVCRGCVIKVKDENGNIQNKTVCKNGPVFAGGEVVW